MVFYHLVLEVLLMPQGNPPDSRKAQQWRQLLELWRRSGLSVRAFCRRHHLAEPTFYAWRRLLSERPSSAPVAGKPLTFVPPEVRHDTPPTAPTLELVLSNGRCLRIPQGFDPAALRRLLAALEDHSC
jgi:transposase-like protein